MFIHFTIDYRFRWTHLFFGIPVFFGFFGTYTVSRYRYTVFHTVFRYTVRHKNVYKYRHAGIDGTPKIPSAPLQGGRIVGIDYFWGAPIEKRWRSALPSVDMQQLFLPGRKQNLRPQRSCTTSCEIQGWIWRYFTKRRV